MGLLGGRCSVGRDLLCRRQIRFCMPLPLWAWGGVGRIGLNELVRREGGRERRRWGVVSVS